MRNLFILLITGMIALSCQSGQSDQPKLQAYFDLDSLLDSQVALLIEKRSGLTKTLTSNGETEERKFVPDSTRWRDEFKMIRDFNLNLPHYVGAYVKEQVNDQITYTPKKGQKVEIKSFSLSYKGDELKEIKSSLGEYKYIYSHQRSIALKFEGGMLVSYQIDGAQNMILKDEISYTISGKITP